MDDSDQVRTARVVEARGPHARIETFVHARDGSAPRPTQNARMAGDVLTKLDLDFGAEVPVLSRPLARHPSESATGFALRLAALLFVWDGRTEVREGVCRGHEPALADPGPPRAWFDVGGTDAARRRRALSSCERHVCVVALGEAGTTDELDGLSERLTARCEVWRADVDELVRRLEGERRLRGSVQRDEAGLVLELRAGARPCRVRIARSCPLPAAR